MMKYIFALALLAALWATGPAMGQFVFGGGGGSSVPSTGSTGFTSLTTNPGSYTLANTDRGLTISGPDQGADGINAACKTAPAAPYSIIAHFNIGTLVVDPTTAGLAANDSGGGLGWRASASGKLIVDYLLIYPGGNVWPTMYSIDFSDPSTYGGSSEGNAAYFGAIGTQPSGWQKLVDNGTQIQAFYSYDGTTWSPTYNAIAYASTYTGGRPNQVCLFASGHGAAVSITLDYYQETSP